MNEMTNDFYSLACRRRSVRRYTEQPLEAEEVRMILSAALMAPSSRNRHSSYFVVVEDPDRLHALSLVREHGSGFVAQAPLVVVVLGDPMISQRWREDAAIAATYIQLQAEDLGLGSCWCQIAEVVTAAGQDADDYVRQLLDLPYQLQVLCIIAIGHKRTELPAKERNSLPWERVHIETYDVNEHDNEI